MRPGCDRPAAARLAFDPIALQLWVDPLGPRSAPVQELCEFHIERLTIPRGWSATDRRPGPSVVGIARSPVGAMARTAVPVVEHPVRDTAPEPEPEPVVLEPEPVAPEPEPVALEPEPVAARARARRAGAGRAGARAAARSVGAPGPGPPAGPVHP